MKWGSLFGRGPVIGVSLLLVSSAISFAQVPGNNVNMVSGTSLPGGDPFLQRQDEPSVALSSRHALRLLAGANDYRTVDLPGLPDGDETGDAWLGVFKSNNGGLTWTSTLIPGYPQDLSPQGLSSPIHGFQAAADPTVRAGTNGMFYYSGIAFNRGTNAPGAIFVARYIDNNNKENGDPIQYLSTALIDTGNSGQFIDKPWLAADVPLAGAPMCSIPTTPVQTFPAGNVYIAYAVFPGSNNNQILFARSTDCGATWTKPAKLSEGQQLSQGVTMVISPVSAGPSTPHAIYVAWRRFANPNGTDAILIARSLDGGQTFSKATVVANMLPGVNPPFDQGTSSASFRTDTFPSMAIDSTGRVYLVWSQRNPAGNARIVISSCQEKPANPCSSPDGSSWTTPAYVDPAPMVQSQQFMPSITFTANKLMVLYYDSLEDHTVGVLAKTCPAEKTCIPFGQFFSEYRQPVAASELPGLFSGFLSDAGLHRRRTLDVRTAQADPGASPAFGPSVRVSNYLYGSSAAYATKLGLPTKSILQLQFNPENLPMFKLGTVPFIGDYIDFAGPVLGPSGNGWAFVSPSSTQIAHAVWTDNRDVRSPTTLNAQGFPDWTHYTPPTVSGTGVICSPGDAGMRNQNIYTARVSQGVLFQALENAKPLSTSLQRGFVLVVQNLGNAARSFQLTIGNQPPNGKASFSQSPLAGFPDPLTMLNLQVAPRSSVSRTVYVTSSDPHASLTTTLQELNASGTPASSVVLNPDPTNPDVINPDVINGVINPDVINAEVYNPDVINPDVTTPDVINPDVINPDVINPDVINTVVLNPDVINPDVINPDVINPDVINPDVINPDVINSSLSDFNLSEASSTITNTGNTSASYNVNLLGTDPLPASFAAGGGSFLQLIVTKNYVTQTIQGCSEIPQVTNLLVANITKPVIKDISNTLPADTDAAVAAVTTPDSTTGAISNATVGLQPGESARVRVRVFQKKSDTVQFHPNQSLSPVTVAHGANTNNAAKKAPFAVRLTIVGNKNNLPAAVANKPYSAAIKAIGGKGTLTWSIVSGSLPTGLTLNSATGLISGTPKVSGPYPVSFPFTLRVSDPAGNQFTRDLTIVVNNK